MTKVLYLSTLCKGSKPDAKVMKIIKEAVGSVEFTYNNQKKPMSSREFILKFIPEFLDYAIDYSITEYVNERLHQE